VREATTTTMYKVAMSPRRVTNNTAQVGSIIDTLGWEYCVFDIHIGTIADVDATFAVLMEASNAADLTGAVAVADDDMVSQTIGVAPETAAGFTFANDGEVRKLEYNGDLRYVRMTITPTNNAGNADIAVGCRLGSPGLATVVQGPT
jgi:hypothetical protein